MRKDFRKKLTVVTIRKYSLTYSTGAAIASAASAASGGTTTTAIAVPSGTAAEAPSWAAGPPAETVAAAAFLTDSHCSSFLMAFIV